MRAQGEELAALHRAGVICRTIEIDVRQMLGEGALPSPLEPVDDILL